MHHHQIPHRSDQMDSPSGGRPKLPAKRGDVAGENHMPQLKNQIK
ncbi:hypothetical protein L195_g064705, partial [Trifolium pratense]